VDDPIIDQAEEIVDILPSLLDAIGNISAIRLLILKTDNQSNRIVDLPEMKPIVEKALHVRQQYKIPFWEAVLLISRQESASAMKLVLDAAVHHQSMANAEKEIYIDTDELSSSVLRDITATVGKDQIITLSSKTETKDSSSPAHLQMLDFRIRPSDENERLATDILKRVGVNGILLNSGNSYHFYGYHLMKSDTELANFLGKVSLFAPFIDQRWVAHQMIEGACALRISKGKSFTKSPLLVRIISD
jgi:hypothetical protein